jgi:hypothetical protein
LIRYARWLRVHYAFPIRVPVYLSPQTTITTMHGEQVSASFFAPWDSRSEPYIRIATGDYSGLLAARGRDNALASYLVSLSHEVTHYRQWIETGDTWERGVVRRATRMVDSYATTVAHP